jgi:hypothetical protein
VAIGDEVETMGALPEMKDHFVFLQPPQLRARCEEVTHFDRQIAKENALAKPFRDRNIAHITNTVYAIVRFGSTKLPNVVQDDVPVHGNHGAGLGQSPL